MPHPHHHRPGAAPADPTGRRSATATRDRGARSTTSRARIALVGAATVVAALVGSAGPATAATPEAGPRLLATPVPLGPTLGPTDVRARIEVRNAGETASEAPTVVELDGPGTVSTTPDWRCAPAGSLARCTLDEGVPAGDTAPPLVVRRPIVLGGGTFYPGGSTVSVAIPGSPDSGGSVDVPAAVGPTPDLAVAAESAGPAPVRGPRRFRVVVRNLGDRPTTDPVRVALTADADYAAVTSAAGDGWSCDPSPATCTRDAPLQPGSTAPAIAVVTGPPGEDVYSGGSARLGVRVTPGGAGDTPDNDRTSAAVPLVNPRTVLLVPGVEDAGLPADADGRGRFRVRVHNVGEATSAGRVTVTLGRDAGTPDTGVDASGTGWSCPQGTGRCTTDAAAPAGGELPPLTVAVPRTLFDPRPRQVLHARVSGGGDDDDLDGRALGSRVADDLADDGRDVVVRIVDVRPSVDGGDGTFDVVARNPTTTDRTAPTTVVVGAPGGTIDGTASGPGWTCTSEPRCVTDRTLPAGGSLPRITVRLRTSSVYAGRLRFSAPSEISARPGDADPVLRAGSASALLPVARRGADLVPTVTGTRPARGGEQVDVRTDVRNTGTRPTTGRIAVELDAADQDVETSSGDGWACNGRSCSTDAVVPPGGALPTITTRQQIPVGGDDHSRVARVRLTVEDPRDDLDVANSDVWSDGETAPARTDLVPSIEDLTPELGDAPAAARVVVRNTGSEASSGPVVVRGDARMSGDGWTCGRVCRHPGPVAPGGRLPALRAVVPIPSGAYGDPVRTSRYLTVGVENRSDGEPGNDEMRATVAAVGTPPTRPLALEVDRATGPDPRTGGLGITGAIVGRSTVPGATPVRLRVVPSPGVVVVGSTLDGRSCEAVTTCTVETPLGRLDRVRFSVGVRLDPGVDRGSVRLVATSADPAADPAEATAPVVLAPDAPDVSLTVHDARPAIADRGATAVADVRSTGGPTDAPIDVTFNLPYGDAASATGPGWACARESYAVRCRWNELVGPGRALPPITVRTAAASRYSSVYAIEGEATTRGDTNEYNGRATTTLSVADPFGPGLVTAVDPAPEADGPDAGFDVLVRNPDDATTTRPVEVLLGTDGPARRGAARDLVPAGTSRWSCDGAVCAFDGRLGPGQTAPPLRIRDPGSPTSPFSARSLSVSSDSAGPAGAQRPAAGPAAPVLTTSVDAVPADASGPDRVVVRTANLGGRPTDGPVEIASSVPARPTVGGSSGGWVCPDTRLVCRLDRPLAAGEEAPPLELDPPTGVRPRESRITAASYVVDATRSGQPGGVSVRTSFFPPGLEADPAVDLGIPGPLRAGRTAEVTATARNAGTLPAPGPVVVDLAIGLPGGFRPTGPDYAPSGDGWTCTTASRPRCTHDGPLPGAGALPPITLTIAGDDPASEVEARVATSEFGGPRSDNDTAVSVVGRAPDVPRLTATVRGARPVLPGEPVVASVVVRNDGTGPRTGEVVLRLPQHPAGAVAGGAGWTCDALLVCRRPGPVPAGEALPEVRVTAIAGVEQRGVSARVDSDASPFDTSAVGSFVTSPAPRSADLVPAIVADDGPVAGGDWPTEVVVRNHGRRAAAGVTEIRLDGGPVYGRDEPAALPAGSTASGVGWACSALRCSTAADVAAGDELPPLRVVVPITGQGTPYRQTISATLATSTQQDRGNDRVRIEAGIAPGRAAPVDGVRSAAFSVGTAADRVRPGERVVLQVPLSGAPRTADRDATLTVDLPAELRYDGVADGGTAPSVDGRRLRLPLRTPRDGEDALRRFWVVVATDAVPGAASLAGELAVAGRSTPERHRSEIAVVAPRVDRVGPARLTGGRESRIVVTGALLHDDDRYELVRGAETFRGVQASGDDRSISFDVDLRDARSGSYDLVVRTTTGQVLRAADAVAVRRAPEAPGTPAAPEPATPGGSPAPSGGSGAQAPPGTVAPADPFSPARLAELLAALGAPPPAPAPPSRSVPAAAVRFSGTLRPPRPAVLARRGWVVTVRLPRVDVVRAELVADAATARRLRIRVGTVIARVRTGPRGAGTAGLRLAVPSRLRPAVRRAGRISGTLRVSVTLAQGSSSASRRVVLRR